MKKKLNYLAEKYETAEFLNDDPSQFMHQFSAKKDQERAAFIAAALSYGSRKQFIPKIYSLKPLIVDGVGKVSSLIPDNDDCFYRLHTNHAIVKFINVLDEIETNYGSLGGWIKQNDVHTGIEAVKLITSFFAERDASELIPRNTSSACKRVCMFLRWMVRDDSPVDLGLWSDMIDKRTLIIPMDTHVLQEAQKFGFIKSKTGSMGTAIKLSEKMKEYFPDDPAKADFALFGLGVDRGERILEELRGV